MIKNIVLLVLCPCRSYQQQNQLRGQVLSYIPAGSTEYFFSRFACDNLIFHQGFNDFGINTQQWLNIFCGK